MPRRPPSAPTTGAAETSLATSAATASRIGVSGLNDRKSCCITASIRSGIVGLPVGASRAAPAAVAGGPAAGGLRRPSRQREAEGEPTRGGQNDQGGEQEFH